MTLVLIPILHNNSAEVRRDILDVTFWIDITRYPHPALILDYRAGNHATLYYCNLNLFLRVRAWFALYDIALSSRTEYNNCTGNMIYECVHA